MKYLLLTALMMCCSGGGTLFSTTPNAMVNAHPYRKYYRFPTLHKLFFSDHRKRLHLLPPGYRKIVSMEKFDGGFGFGGGSSGGCGCCAAMMQQQSCGCGGGGMMSPNPCGCNGGGGGAMVGFPYHNQYNRFQNRYKNTSDRIYKNCRHKCSKKIGPLRRRRCKRRCKRQKKRRNRRNEKIWMTGPNGRSYEARHMMGPREFQRQLTPVTGTYPPRGYCRKAQRIYNPYYQSLKRMRKLQRRQMRLYRSPYGYGGGGTAAMIGGSSCGCREGGIRQTNVPLVTNGLGSVYGYNPVLQSLGLKNPRLYALSKPSCSTFTPYVGPRPVGRELFVPPMMMPVPKWMIGPNGLNGNMMMGRYGVRYPMMGYGRMGGMMGGGMGGMMSPMMGSGMNGMINPMMMRMNNPMMMNAPMINNPMMMNPMMRRF